MEVVLEVDDVEGCYRHLLDSGYSVVDSLRGHPWGLMDFPIADPDSYSLRLISRNES